MTELDQHLARTCWHLVAHRCELLQDRDYIRLPWLLGDLTLYNDRGTVLAFDNICPHRGARFFTDPHGNAPALCPYHGWSYRGGQLRIPHPERYDPCALAAVRLNEHHTAWCGDFLFAAIAPTTDLATQLGGTAPLLQQASILIDRRRDLNHYAYHCDWRVAVENALEPDHVHMVHTETLHQLDLQPGRNTYHGRNTVLTAAIGHPRTARRLAAISRWFDVPPGHDHYTAIHVFPFAFLSSTFGYTYALQSFLPAKAPKQTEFTSRLLTTRLTNPSAEPMAATFFDSVAAMNRQVFEEDHAICRRIDPAFPFTGPLSATEEKVAHFRSSLTQAAAEGTARNAA